jgi:hypothetical protein
MSEAPILPVLPLRVRKKAIMNSKANARSESGSGVDLPQTDTPTSQPTVKKLTQDLRRPALVGPEDSAISAPSVPTAKVPVVIGVTMVCVYVIVYTY